MARKPRIHLPDALYHVMLRGNAGQAIFFSDKDRRHFETFIRDGLTRFGHRIHAYCWMENHIHLIVQVADAALSEIMQNLAFRYTRWINQTQERSGHLFQGRYKAILVDADAYLLELVRYIHLNPVRAGLVKDPADYPKSGHRSYLGLDNTTWLTTNWVLAQFADDQDIARQRYADFASAGIDEGRRAEFHRGSAQGRLLGNDDFVEKALSQAEQSVQPRARLETIISMICAARHMDLEELSAIGRHRAPADARALVAYLAVANGAATLTRLSQVLNRDLATLSNAVSRLRNRIKHDPETAAEVKRLQVILNSNMKLLDYQL